MNFWAVPSRLFYLPQTLVGIKSIQDPNSWKKRTKNAILLNLSLLFSIQKLVQRLKKKKTLLTCKTLVSSN